MTTRTSRRAILQVSGATLLTTSLTACDAFSTTPAKNAPAKGGQTSENPSSSAPREAPALAQRVKDGDLPQLRHRMPEQPMTLQPVDQLGSYGGDWGSMVSGPTDSVWLTRTIRYENLVRWKPTAKSLTLDAIIPNVASSFKTERDGARYEFSLRPGMKWSDGKPFTADDILFAHDDVLLNKDLRPVYPSWLTAGGEPAKVEKVDDHTVAFTFAAPNGLFLARLATTTGDIFTTMPAHYLKRFHKTYTPDAQQQAKDAGQKDWMALFEQKSDDFNNTEKPVLNAWSVTRPLSDGRRTIAERNPYYWKTDSKGSQLPYIDRVDYQVVGSTEVMLLKVQSGEIDMDGFHVATVANKPVLARNRSRGGYRFYDTVPGWMNYIIIELKLTNEDPVKRQVLQNVDFRIALSHAIDRNEIIDAVYQQQGEAWQGAPRPESDLHDKTLAKQYTAHDPKKAAALLDTVLPEMDGGGMRLGPDGNPFSLRIEVPSDVQPDWPQAMELVARYWTRAGVKTSIRPISRSLWEVRRKDNSIDGTVWRGDGGLAVMLDPRYYFPAKNGSDFASPWADWYVSRGEEGSEPPQVAKQQMDLYDRVQATADPEKQQALMKELLRITREQFWVMGIAIPKAGYGVAGDTFHNVPSGMLDSWKYPTPAPTNPCQYFIEKS